MARDVQAVRQANERAEKGKANGGCVDKCRVEKAAALERSMKQRNDETGVVPLARGFRALRRVKA